MLIGNYPYTNALYIGYIHSRLNTLTNQIMDIKALDKTGLSDFYGHIYNYMTIYLYRS